MRNPEHYDIKMGVTSGDFRYIGIQPPVDDLEIEWDSVGETDSHWQIQRLRTIVPSGKGEAYSQIGFEFTLSNGNVGIMRVAKEIASMIHESGATSAIDERIRPIGHGYYLFGGEAETLG